MAATVPVTGWAHAGVRVHDLQASRSFYELLGFELILGPVGPEPVAILKHPAGVEINLVLNAAPTSTTNVLMDVPEKHPGYTHISLLVSSIEATRTALEAAGYTISGEMEIGPLKAVFVRDPDGNVVEFDELPRS